MRPADRLPPRRAPRLLAPRLVLGAALLAAFGATAGCRAVGDRVEDATRERVTAAIDARADELGVRLSEYGIDQSDSPTDALRKIAAVEASQGNSEVVSAVMQARSLSEAVAILASVKRVISDAEARQAELEAAEDVAKKAAGGAGTLGLAVVLGLLRALVKRKRAGEAVAAEKVSLEGAYKYVLDRIEAAGPAAQPVKDAIAAPTTEGDREAAATVAAAVKERFG